MSKYWYYAKLSFLDTTAYRFSMLMSLVVAPLTVLIQYFIWSALLSSQATVAGFTLEEAMQYFFVATLLGYAMYTGITNSLTRLVLRGEVTRDLLRPVSILGYLSAEAVGHRLMALFIEIIPLVIAAGILFGIEIITPQLPVYFVISVIITFTLSILWSYLFGLIAFWSKQTNGTQMISWTIFLLFAGFSLPLNIYPETFQSILAFSPTSHLLYTPVQMFLGDYALGIVESEIHAIAISIIWVLLLYIAARIMQKAAFRKYQGVGQ